jgi:hypothetical protein
MPHGASARYWQERPERQTLVYTALGALRLLATQAARVQQRAQPTGAATPSPGIPGGVRKLSADRTWGWALAECFDFLQDEVRRMADPSNWEDRHETRAARISGLSMLRTLVGRLDRAAAEWARSGPEPHVAAGNDHPIVPVSEPSN